MITTTNEVYAFVEVVIVRCREHGWDDITQQLDSAMQLGSSGMEILGAIKSIFVDQTASLEKIVDKASIEEVIEQANQAFGLSEE